MLSMNGVVEMDVGELGAGRLRSPPSSSQLSSVGAGPGGALCGCGDALSCGSH